MFHKRIVDHSDLNRPEEVTAAVRALDQRMSAMQESISDTISRFGGRLGKLEAKNEVQDEQVKSIKETLTEVKAEIRASQTEQKNSIAELRMENKESMSEIKRNYKEILDAVTPMKHEINDVEQLKKELDELKAKPAKTWESIKEKGLNWILILILTIVACALGLSKYL